MMATAAQVANAAFHSASGGTKNFTFAYKLQVVTGQHVRNLLWPRLGNWTKMMNF